MSKLKIKQIEGLQNIIDSPTTMGIEYIQNYPVVGSATGNNSPTGVFLDYKPFADSAIQVLINGVGEYRNFETLSGTLYFSNDGGVNFKSINNLQAGDQLYWNALNSYPLSNTDSIAIIYEREYSSYTIPLSATSSLLTGNDLTSTVTIDGSLVISGTSSKFTLNDGTQNENYIMVSDVSGLGSWTASSFINTPTIKTYDELKTLKDNNQLVIGNKYLLLDYVHTYQILGSDSGAITQYHTMIGSTVGYCEFVDVSQDVAVNSIVTATNVPTGASIANGQTFSVVSYYNNGYIKLSGNANNIENIGTIYKFEKQRYPNVPTDSIIYDTYGNIVMKKGGVINTEVHNGLPYMSMSALENPVVPAEKIVLTAIDTNTFSINAESLTFLGDTVEYRFDNSFILDEDGNPLVATRRGFVIGRTNNDLNISMNKDWRSQRYRRYKIDDTNWNNLLLSGTNSSLYTLNNKNYASKVNSVLDEGHKYLLRFPTESDMYVDFYSSTNTDTFKNGEASELTSGILTRLANDYTNTYNKTISTSFSTLNLAFDYPIIPMDVYTPKVIVKKAVITELYNTVFKDLNQIFGDSNDYYINIYSVSNSTIGTGINIKSTGSIFELKTMDSMGINNIGTISNLLITTNGSFDNLGEITNSRIGGYYEYSLNSYVGLKLNNSIIYNSIFGFARANDINVTNSYINRSMFLIHNPDILTLSGNIYHTSINAPVSIYSSNINLNNFNVVKAISSTQSKGLYGVKHTISSNINNTIIDNYNPKLDLVSKYMDISYNTTYSVIGVTE